MKQCLMLGVFALLACCGPLNEGRGSTTILSGLAQATGLTETEPTAPAGLPPEVANAGPGNVLVVTLRARGLVAPMVRAGQNGNRTTWISPGKVSMTFQDDLLISTRGLGDDLMGADVGGIQSAIQNGNGTILRRMSFLDSLDQIQTYELTCTVATQGSEEVQLISGPASLRKVTEDCSHPRLRFENTYWLRGAEIVKSRQVISITQGFIDVEAL